jgi:hypothetical protein
MIRTIQNAAIPFRKLQCSPPIVRLHRPGGGGIARRNQPFGRWSSRERFTAAIPVGQLLSRQMGRVRHIGGIAVVRMAGVGIRRKRWSTGGTEGAGMVNDGESGM